MQTHCHVHSNWAQLEYNSSRKHLSYNLQLTNSVIDVYGRWLTRHMANHQAPWLHRQHGHRSHERRWDTGHMSTGYKHLPAASPRSAYDNRCTSVNTDQSKRSTRNPDWQEPAGSKKKGQGRLYALFFFFKGQTSTPSPFFLYSRHKSLKLVTNI